jgi:two-component system OmpR family sensor kinase
MVITVWRSSSSDPAYQSHRQVGIPRTAPSGFSKKMIDGREWRLFARNLGDEVIIAAQPAAIRDSAARKITARTLLPTLGVLPLAAFLILLAVAFGLRPLAKITQELRDRSPRDLSPIEADRLPPDIAPLARALNELMVRLAAVIATQRTFIADAAHELLTPLAALQLQAQLLARSKTPIRREEAIAELQAGVARTLQLARQLLTLARHDAEVDRRELTEVDLVGVVKQIMAIHRTLADEKALRIDIAVAGRAIVAGNEESLATLISNLVENSIKYSRRGGCVRIDLRCRSSGVELRVEDSGPGIPAEERQRVFDRFYRRPGMPVGGNGLGLAIAKEIAERHLASIALETSETLGGLSARVLFPSARAAPEPRRASRGSRWPDASAVASPGWHSSGEA